MIMVEYAEPWKIHLIHSIDGKAQHFLAVKSFSKFVRDYVVLEMTTNILKQGFLYKLLIATFQETCVALKLTDLKIGTPCWGTKA